MLSLLQTTLCLIAVTVAKPVVKPLSPSSLLPLPPSFIHDGDAQYDVPNAKLRSVLTCPLGNPTRTSRPVLLVPAAGWTGKDAFLEGYVAGLASKGFTPCYMDLPQSGTGDMQVSSAYVAYNLHLLSWLASGNQVTVLGHGQAASVVQWAFEFFPSSKHVAKAFVGLAPILNGVDSLTAEQTDCAIEQNTNELRCLPYVWQQKSGSKYYESRKYKYNVAQVPTTLIWSESDATAHPAYENAHLPGAISIAIQDLCPERRVDHNGVLNDAAAFELVSYTLLHGSHAAVVHANPHSVTICRQSSAPSMWVPGKSGRFSSFAKAGQRLLSGSESTSSSKAARSIINSNESEALATKVAQEPALLPYAQLRNQ